MTSTLKFVTYGHPEPQGSARAFVVNGRAIVTSDNAKVKPFRSEVARCALEAMHQAGMNPPLAGTHEPLHIKLDFYLSKPPSTSKKRLWPTVRPDLDKLVRSIFDALKGVAYVDDSQIVQGEFNKHYGSPERVEVTVSPIEREAPEIEHAIFQESSLFGGANG